MAATVIPPHGATSETLASANIEVHVGGNVTGTLVAGNYNIVNTADGALINVFQGKITTERRPVPVRMRPRPFAGLLGRASEISAAQVVLQQSLPFEFYAASGWGKTVLLRHLANHLSLLTHPEGIVYERAAGFGASDLLQFIFDAFYETSVPLRPTEVHLRQHLQSVQALVVLDDLDLSRPEVDSLLDAVPNCIFLVASTQRNLWGEGRAALLRGLGATEGVQLFEREVGRKLTSGEEAAAKRLSETLSGHPLRLIEAAALVLEEKGKRRMPAALLREASIPQGLTHEVFERLTEAERRVLSLLAAVPEADVSAEHVAAIGGVPEAGVVLRKLEEQGLLESEQGRFRLRATSRTALEGLLQPESWLRPVVDHFVKWGGGHSNQPAMLLEQSNTLLAALSAAESIGAWKEVLHLVRAVEFAFAVAARWGHWERVLRQGLNAAQTLGDRAAVAWAFHQLGTRALCLGDAQTANAYLERALELRRSASDRQGEAVTRHNLRRGKPRSWLSRAGVVGAGAAVAGAVAAILIGHAVLAGSGQATVDPPWLNLGSVPVGGAASAKVTLQNTGRGELLVDSMTVEGNYSQANDCPPKQALRQEQRCTVTVTFTPKASGPRNGRLVVHGAGGAASVALTGNGLAPNVVVQPSRIEFGGQRVGQTSAAQGVQLKNTGNAPLTVSDMKRTGDFEFTSSCGALPLTLPAQSGCMVSVGFKPTASGRMDGSLTFRTSSGPASVALTGQGTPGPTTAPTPTPSPPTLAPDTTDFGRQAVNTLSDSKPVTLTNPSTEPLSLTAISATGPFLVPPASCSSVAAHGQCLIPVFFRPSSRGPATGTLVAVDAAGHQYHAILSGTGLAPEVSLSPGSLDWTGNGKKQQPVTIRNTGDATLMINSVTVDNTGGWSVDAVCDNRQLQPQGTCTVMVTFLYPGFPRPPERVSGQLSVNANALGSPVTLTGMTRDTRIP